MLIFLNFTDQNKLRFGQKRPIENLVEISRSFLTFIDLIDLVQNEYSLWEQIYRLETGVNFNISFILSVLQVDFQRCYQGFDVFTKRVFRGTLRRRQNRRVQIYGATKLLNYELIQGLDIRYAHAVYKHLSELVIVILVCNNILVEKRNLS